MELLDELIGGSGLFREGVDGPLKDLALSGNHGRMIPRNGVAIRHLICLRILWI